MSLRVMIPQSCVIYLCMLFGIIICLLGFTIQLATSSSLQPRRDFAKRQRKPLLLQTLACRELYTCFPTGHDIGRFLRYVETYDSPLTNPSMDSLLDELSPTHLGYQNAQIIRFIAAIKGSDSLQARNFLLRCLKQSAFNSQVWSSYASLAHMSRIEFFRLIASLCGTENSDLFVNYVVYEILSILGCAALSVPSAALVLLLAKQYALSLVVAICVFIYSYLAFLV